MGPHAHDTFCATQCNIYTQLTLSMGWAGQTSPGEGWPGVAGNIQGEGPGKVPPCGHSMRRGGSAVKTVKGPHIWPTRIVMLKLHQSSN